MENLYLFVFYALVTPVITLGAGSVLAQQPIGQPLDREKQTNQREQGATQSSTQSTPQARRTDSQTAAAHENALEQPHRQNQRYRLPLPDNAPQASDLIGAKLRTINDKDSRSVDYLVTDESDQVVAIVAGQGIHQSTGRMRALRRSLKDGIESRHPPLMVE